MPELTVMADVAYTMRDLAKRSGVESMVGKVTFSDGAVYDASIARVDEPHEYDVNFTLVR